jgi:DNA-directed RNA polymerase subunit A'
MSEDIVGITHLCSPEDVRRQAVKKIFHGCTFDNNKKPFEDGLMDLCMGVVQPDLKCETCGGGMDECTGHFGYIDLTKPVLHIGYIKEIYDLLRFTCRYCGTILLANTEIGRYKSAVKQMDCTICPYCGGEQRKITLIQMSISDKCATLFPSGVIFENEYWLIPSEIQNRLKNISDEDVKSLVILPDNTRPEWLVLEALSVIPPVKRRPDIIDEEYEPEEGYHIVERNLITHILQDIMWVNSRLKHDIDAGVSINAVEELWLLLQKYVDAYVVQLLDTRKFYEPKLYMAQNNRVSVYEIPYIF